MRMTSSSLRSLSAVAGVALVAVLAGCGSSQSSSGSADANTQATTSEQPAVQTETATTNTATQPAPETTGTTTSGGSSGGEPAYVEPDKDPEGLAGAEAALRAHGYTPVETATYKPQQTLRVMLGSSAGGEHAFFFIGNRFIGTDSKTASTHLLVAAQHEGSVTLRYSLYKQGKPAGTATVTFLLEDGMLVPQQTVPPEASRTSGG
jgi:hypothetical protein